MWITSIVNVSTLRDTVLRQSLLQYSADDVLFWIIATTPTTTSITIHTVDGNGKFTTMEQWNNFTIVQNGQHRSDFVLFLYAAFSNTILFKGVCIMIFYFVIFFTD